MKPNATATVMREMPHYHHCRVRWGNTKDMGRTRCAQNRLYRAAAGAFDWNFSHNCERFRFATRPGGGTTPGRAEVIAGAGGVTRWPPGPAMGLRHPWPDQMPGVGGRSEGVRTGAPPHERRAYISMTGTGDAGPLAPVTRADPGHH